MSNIWSIHLTVQLGFKEDKPSTDALIPSHYKEKAMISFQQLFQYIQQIKSYSPLKLTVMRFHLVDQ
jgi:hypothetical protein